MTEPAISIQDLTKSYKLGAISRHTLADEMQHIWCKLRGRDPEEMLGKVSYESKSALESAVAKTNREFKALENISFDVEHGDTVGIIGTNGAGKSTLLKILSRITSPTTGKIIINGRVGSLLEVGTGFHPELTGSENVYMNGTILGMKKREIDLKYQDIVNFSEMSKFMGTPVKRYSSGMRVRLAFAVAAHLDPEILLVDEVLAVGDLSFQKKCLGKMQEVASEGRTILFVSHNMAAVARLCNKGVVLKNGRKMFEGNSDKAVSEYTAMALSTSSFKRWSDAEAPGELGFKLKGLGILDESNQKPAMIDVTRKYKVLVAYEVTEPEQTFRLRVEMGTQGVCAFSVVEPKEWKRTRGHYLASFWIPAHFLAEGEYLISLIALTSRGGKRMPLCRLIDGVAFHTVDHVEGNSARGDYAEKMDGVMRPKLEWMHSESASGDFSELLQHEPSGSS